MMNRDFEEFLSARPVSPPEGVSSAVVSRVRCDFRPAAWQVFVKVALVHVIVGALTLLVCPQFGFSFMPGQGLMSILMGYNQAVCMFGCGALFLGGSALVASLVLQPEEIRAIRRHEILQLTMLASLSVGVFVCVLGSSVIAAFTWVWLAGSVVGGLASLELGWALRLGIGRRGVRGL